MTYLDASFLVALYTPDKNRGKASSSLATTDRPLLVSPLCELESVNAFRLRVFRKDASEAEARNSVRDLEYDFTTGFLQRTEFSSRAFPRAHQLSQQYSVLFGTRGSDILHVAIALELKATAFYSFDVQQRKLAQAVGLDLNHL